MTGAPLKIGIVAGEESGDLLAADLVSAIALASGGPVDLVGVGGEHLADNGLISLFDPSEIALMGIAAVVKHVPKLLFRIRQTANALISAEPDVLIIVDSPEFTHRVARRVRAAKVSIPIVNYVCPSVWAWRPGRAPAMRPYIDHVLCLLPFEPGALERLGGPPGTFVGHRLTTAPGILKARAARRTRQTDPAKLTLLLLPGSRRAEVSSLLPFFRETVACLTGLGAELDLILPTVTHVEPLVRELIADWPQPPRVVAGEEAKYAAFGEADAAIAASGTVTLELALAGVPMISTYKTDMIGRMLRGMIKSWSVSLPNLVADRPVVPELYDLSLRPGNAARHLLGLMENGPARDAQIAGFERIRARMETGRSAGSIAAEAVLTQIDPS